MLKSLAEKLESQQASLAQLIETAVTTKLAEANASFVQEQARVTSLVEQLRTSIATVNEGKLKEVLPLAREARGG